MIRSRTQKVFEIINIFILIMISFTIVIPILHILSVSLSSSKEVANLSVTIYPKGFNIAVYKDILLSKLYLRSLRNTVFVTIMYTIIALIVNTMVSYCLSKEFYGKKFITYMFIITMYFNGGLIPTYLVVSKYLKLYNTYFALFLPWIINVFYIIVIRSQIEAVPSSILEAAVIDGAKQHHILFNIIIPAIKPTIAAIGMFLALFMWNMWFSVLLYTNTKELWTLQYYLRSVIISNSLFETNDINNTIIEEVNVINYRMASIILVAIPIISIYPFVQKYFVKGILVGSVKG